VKNNTIKTALKKSQLLPNRYEVQPDTYLTLDLPNGKTLDIYVSESGRYTDITVNDHQNTDNTKITTEDDYQEHSDFTAETKTVVAKSCTTDYHADYTVVKYRKFNQK